MKAAAISDYRELARRRLIGRAWAYALAGAGQRGVRHILNLINDEMRVAMALTGVTSPSQLNGSNIVKNYTGGEAS